jgi:hypothetical protein
MVRALGRRPTRATAPRRPPDGAGPHRAKIAGQTGRSATAIPTASCRRPPRRRPSSTSGRFWTNVAKARAEASPRHGLTTRRPAQPAIFSVIGSKPLPRLYFSSAAFRLRPTNPWRLGDPSVYLPSWKSEDSQPSSGKRRRKRRAGAARTESEGRDRAGRIFVLLSAVTH